LLAAITVVELFRAADQYSNSHYKYLEPMTLVGVFFLLVSIPSAISATSHWCKNTNPFYTKE